MWKNPPPREIIDGRWRPVLSGNSRSIVPLEESIDFLIERTSDELLLRVFEIATEHQLSLPREINE